MIISSISQINAFKSLIVLTIFICFKFRYARFKTQRAYFCSNEEGIKTIYCRNNEMIADAVMKMSVLQSNTPCYKNGPVDKRLIKCSKYIPLYRCISKSNCSFEVNPRSISCPSDGITYPIHHYELEYRCYAVFEFCLSTHDKVEAINELDGFVVSPSYPNNYPPGRQQCQMYISVPDDLSIVLTVVEFSMKRSLHCLDDYLEILVDVSAENAEALWERKFIWCGALRNFSDNYLSNVPSKSPVDLKANNVYLVFNSSTDTDYEAADEKRLFKIKFSGKKRSAGKNILLTSASFPVTVNTSALIVNGTQHSKRKLWLIIGSITGSLILLAAGILTVILLLKRGVIKRKALRNPMKVSKQKETKSKTNIPNSAMESRNDIKKTNVYKTERTRLIPERTVKIDDFGKFSKLQHQPPTSTVTTPLMTTDTKLGGEQHVYGVDLPDVGRRSPVKEDVKPIALLPEPVKVDLNTEPLVTIETAVERIPSINEQEKSSVDLIEIERNINEIEALLRWLVDKTESINRKRFNPLQVIMRKGTKKYYTTEYV